MNHITFPQGYLDKFRVFKSMTLFEPDWKQLQDMRCPLCGNRLKPQLKGKMAFCNSTKHPSPFRINKSKI